MSVTPEDVVVVAPSVPESQFSEISLEAGHLQPTESKAPADGAVVTEELEGADAWIKYEETADYKYHIVWENAKNRGWRGKCKFLAYKFADGADVVGGAVARFLGITDSRYQHVLDAAERMEEEAARDKQKEDERAIYLENLEAERLAQLEGGVAATGEVKDDVAIASGNKSSPSPADDESSRAAAFNGGVAVASVELSAGPVYRPAPSPSADPRADTSL